MIRKKLKNMLRLLQNTKFNGITEDLQDLKLSTASINLACLSHSAGAAATIDQSPDVCRVLTADRGNISSEFEQRTNLHSLSQCFVRSSLCKEMLH